MNIASVASAFPKHEYDQFVLLSALKKHWGPKLDNPEFIVRLHGRVGVDKRHLALPIEEYEGLKNWKQANDHWIAAATDLGAEALAAACARAETRLWLRSRTIPGPVLPRTFSTTGR